MPARCVTCGHVGADDARFCSSCGKRIEPAADAPTQAMTPVSADDPPPSVSGPPGAAATAEMVVTAGHRSGTRFELAGDRIAVGRHPDSDVFLDDITVSRRHVQLEAGPAGYLLRDVGSLNGTYVNGHRIDGEITLRSGDELQVGKFKLLYLLSPTGP